MHASHRAVSRVQVSCVMRVHKRRRARAARQTTRPSRARGTRAIARRLPLASCPPACVWHTSVCVHVGVRARVRALRPCVCVCACARARACVRARVRACVRAPPPPPPLPTHRPCRRRPCRRRPSRRRRPLPTSHNSLPLSSLRPPLISLIARLSRQIRRQFAVITIFVEFTPRTQQAPSSRAVACRQFRLLSLLLISVKSAVMRLMLRSRVSNLASVCSASMAREESAIMWLIFRSSASNLASVCSASMTRGGSGGGGEYGGGAIGGSGEGGGFRGMEHL